MTPYRISQISRIKIVELLIQNIDINSKQGCLLIYSTLNNHIDIVKLLIDSGADIDVRDSLPIFYARLNSQIYKLFTDLYFPSHKIFCQYRSLFFSSKYRFVHFVNYYLEKGNCSNEEKQSSLVVSTMNGDIDIVKLLLQYGADIYIDIAIRYSVLQGFTDITKLFINLGANVQQDLLRKASLNGYVDIVRLLLNSGANVNDGNDYDGEIIINVSRDIRYKYNVDIESYDTILCLLYWRYPVYKREHLKKYLPCSIQVDIENCYIILKNVFPIEIIDLIQKIISVS
jgi:ankyrin repeat protein